MSDKKYSANDPERTLITLDQLSQTIEVMTSVVNRLRQHLSDQITARREIEDLEQARLEQAEQDNLEPLLSSGKGSGRSRGRGAVVEISQPEPEVEELADEKTLH